MFTKTKQVIKTRIYCTNYVAALNEIKYNLKTTKITGSHTFMECIVYK